MTHLDQHPEVSIVPIQNEADLFQALAIREVVFIEEHGVPEGIERDEIDAAAYHVLAMQGGHAIGTGRLVTRPQPPSGESGLWGRIGRMAVLRASRKLGIGTKILLALEEEARRREMNGIVLHAQLEALEFYKRHGYQPGGAVFEEAGMPHLQMVKKLT